ncbi:MAG TPA: hypothetical protein VHZ95_05165 [Polyangiales bacterium]|nr:hypothetical protein [Polyangiales bacterium]
MSVTTVTGGNGRGVVGFGGVVAVAQEDKPAIALAQVHSNVIVNAKDRKRGMDP